LHSAAQKPEGHPKKKYSAAEGENLPVFLLYLRKSKFNFGKKNSILLETQKEIAKIRFKY
jgi:hypothetical protein